MWSVRTPKSSYITFQRLCARQREGQRAFTGATDMQGRLLPNLYRKGFSGRLAPSLLLRSKSPADRAVAAGDRHGALCSEFLLCHFPHELVDIFAQLGSRPFRRKKRRRWWGVVAFRADAVLDLGLILLSHRVPQSHLSAVPHPRIKERPQNACRRDTVQS